ncbi:MAG: hypothetical protein HKN90_08720, partial [Flavobacteriaceae bacterium]|nr:hypothetical protein [Flavobacteriaceae bacterium]
VLEDVKNEFSLRIKESGAMINATELPVVNGIYFQLEQLFINLIGNAIKFRNVDAKPKIEITAEKVHHRQITEEFTKTHTYYHVIKVIDNGIGFSNSNTEKIFELFQRLHEKHEYSGTGIGLAICKKIVNKHHGHIYATSVKNEGSAFTIYLPSGKLKTMPRSI